MLIKIVDNFLFTDFFFASKIVTDIPFGKNTSCKSLLVLSGMFILGVYEYFTLHHTTCRVAFGDIVSQLLDIYTHVMKLYLIRW
ncbi:hypothetical protein GIB67_041661 [Kingdonia uniflora]|uniref:Uncharacterized protein n=1 Tax=Kingdonia uniflora TaxID=39325 RepID=A0A7J7MQX0_9MAGN|nr:hypothetical protein GIB67_041661 [Kingdonia uniflora]